MAAKDVAKETAKRLTSLFSSSEDRLDAQAPQHRREPSNPRFLVPPSPYDDPLVGSSRRDGSNSPSRSSSPKPRGRGRFGHWRSRSSSPSAEVRELPRYWVEVGGRKLSYDPSALALPQKVPELWDETGDTLIFLSSHEVERPPSFKLRSSVYAASPTFAKEHHAPRAPGAPQREGSLDTATSLLSLDDAAEPAATSTASQTDVSSLVSREPSIAEAPRRDACVYFPILTSTATPVSADELEALLYVRNVFAFLMRQPLVASPQRPTHFYIFRAIAEFLQKQSFSNFDGSTFGEVASANLDFYLDTLRLADVRNNPYKIAEALVLGEEMKSMPLYTEAFVHGVGKFDALKELPESMTNLINGRTWNRMERAAFALETRLRSVRTRLTDFDFPSLFTGIANSTVASDVKSSHFKAWKSSFMALRKHTIAYYKDLYGAWPPKASSKKHDFEESGLNRMVLQMLYRDLTDLYDLLVDRTSLTTRTADAHDHADEETPDVDDSLPRALRRVMSEYDRSSPPVQPPIPFDTPVLPELPRSQVDDYRLRASGDRSRKLTPEETNRVMDEACNPEANKPTVFLASFKVFERKAGQGRSVDELADQRNGHWIFLYAVLQALPMVVIDAPNIRWTQAVEYFLCEPPKGGVPWVKQDHHRQKSWYGVPGGSGVVSLPSDVVDHGIEGIYRRSHCWTAAQKWAAEEPNVDQLAASSIDGSGRSGHPPSSGTAMPPGMLGNLPPPTYAASMPSELPASHTPPLPTNTPPAIIPPELPAHPSPPVATTTPPTIVPPELPSYSPPPVPTTTPPADMQADLPLHPPPPIPSATPPAATASPSPPPLHYPPPPPSTYSDGRSTMSSLSLSTHRPPNPTPPPSQSDSPAPGPGPAPVLAASSGFSPGGLTPATRPRGNSNRASSVFMGLEALPLPAGVTPEMPTAMQRRLSQVSDSAKNFEDILASVEADQQKGKRQLKEEKAKRKRSMIF